MAMSGVIGIDFGTSACRAYVLGKDGPERVTDRHGDVIPSAVAIAGDDAVLVGASALEYRSHSPERVVRGIKRLLGRKLYSPEAKWLAGVCPNEIVPADNGDAAIGIGDDQVTPQEIASYLLRYLRERGQRRTGGTVDCAVITIPGYFGQHQRRALRDAARLAGFRQVRLIDTALAVIGASANALTGVNRLAALDIGAGFYDVSVIERDGAFWRVRAVAGDSVLGGDDFDRRIVEQMIDAFRRKHSIDLSEYPAALYRLADAARTVKESLDAAPASAPVNLAQIVEGPHQMLDLEHPAIPREVLDTMLHTDLESLAAPCAWALEDAGIGTDDLDAVWLIGRGSKIPAITELVEDLFRRHPTGPAEPDSAAALGALLLGVGKGPKVSAVSPLTLGVKIGGGKVCPIVRRNLPIPGVPERAFSASRSSQRSVVFEVYQGEAELARDNLYVGRFEVDVDKAGARFRVGFALDADGVLNVRARDAHSGAPVNVRFQRSSGLTDAQRNELAQQLAQETTLASATSMPPPSGSIDSLRIGGSAGPPSSGRLGDSEPPPSGRRVPVTFPPPPPGGASDDDVRPPRAQRPRETRMSMAEIDVETLTLPESQVPSELRSQLGLEEESMEVGDDSLVGNTLGGRYHIESILGEGAMGRVYQAQHQILKKRLAVKVLHPELAQNERLVERFLREAQAAASIHSDYVVDISDFGRLDDGTSYFVMEYLQGMTLAQMIHHRTNVEPHLIKDIGSQIAEGLAAAHSQGIVHRDLKPENVNLTRKRGNFHAKILDFGIAKSPTSNGSGALTLVGTILGTPHYMAPEQVRGAAVDARTDIYALGVCLYEMATGWPPFDDDSVALLLAKHTFEKPKPIRGKEGCEQFPEPLEAIIMRCLAKEPDERYPSAQELSELLAEGL
jgi:molecular chaperone DnaK (HSP70)/tRNA A-37 threonylcarbamoyl transferase component Bud32